MARGTGQRVTHLLAVGQVKVGEVGLAGGEAQEHPLRSFCAVVANIAASFTPGGLDVGFVAGDSTRVGSF